MRLVRSWLKRFLLSRNAILSRPPGQFATAAIRLKQARDRGLKVNCAIDGGAATGGWAREFIEIYPDARVLCIDPREDVQNTLRQLAGELPGVQVAQTLIGDKIGQVEFNLHADQSSVFSGHSDAVGTKVMADITTIDDLVQKRQLPWPDLIKLDLQGAELRALSGSPQCVAHAQAVLLEVSFIPLMKDWPLIGDVIPFMLERDFICYDICGLWQRPLDGALAQGDFLFLKRGHELLSDLRWNSNGTWVLPSAN